MSDNFQDNIAYGHSTLAVSGDAIIVGSTDAGAKSVIFNNSGSEGHLAWQPSGNHTINLPDANGTIQLTGQVPGGLVAGTQTATSGTVIFSNSNGVIFGMTNSSIITASFSQTVQTQSNIQAIYDGVNSISTGTIRFSNANGVSFGINGQTITASVAVQTNQSIGLYVTGNTTGQSSSSTFDARSMSISGIGNVSIGYSGNALIISGGGGGGSVNISAGTTSNNLTNFVFSNSNGISFGLNGSTITATVIPGAAAGLAAAQAGTQTATSGTIIFSNSNGVTFGMSGSSQITASVAAQTNQSVGLYAIGNTTQNSSTALDARSLSFNGLGAMTMGYSNGSIQASAPATSSLSVSGALSISVNGNTISLGVPTGTVSFVNSNGVTFGTSGSTSITASVAAVVVPSAGTQTALSGTVVFSNSNNITFGMSGSSRITASFSQTVQTQSNIQAIYDGVNSISTGTIRFSNANGVSFGINGQTITASVAGGGGGVALSAGTNSTSTGTVVFSNANGISFGMDTNGVVTASAPAVAGSDVVFSNSNNIFFGKNVSTVTASVGPISAYEPYAANTGSAISSHTPASYWFNRVVFPANIAISNINIIKQHAATAPLGTASNSSGTNILSYSHGITVFTRQNFSNSSTNLSSYTTASLGITANLTHSSSSQSYKISWVTNTTGGTTSFSTTSVGSGWANFITSLKMWQIPMVTTLSAGEYFFAHRHSTTGASTGQTGTIFAVSNLHFTQQVSTIGVISSSGSIVSSHLNGIGFGIASAITSTSTMAASVISAATQQFWYMNFSNA